MTALTKLRPTLSLVMNRDEGARVTEKDVGAYVKVLHLHSYKRHGFPHANYRAT